MGITELLELRRKNLLTDEELAYAIKELKTIEENKANELNDADKKTAERINNDSIDAINLANRNRERAENMRKEWAHKASEQRLSRQQDEELLLAKTVLASLTNRMGMRVYSDEIINNMEYYEAMSLYDGILENMTVENRNELVNKAKKDIKEGKGFNFQPVAPTIPVEPVVPEPEVPAVPEPEEPVIDESQPTIDGEPEIEPLPEEPTVSDENEPEITPIPVVEPEPVPQPEPEPIGPEPLPGFDDSEPEIEPLPDEVEEEVEPEIVPVPVPGPTPLPDPVEPEQEENEEEITPVPEPEEEEEEHTAAPIPVEIVQPKPSLWKKVVIITGAAITFLNGIAIAVHTGLMAKNTNEFKKDTEEIIGLVKQQDQDLDKDDEEKDDKDNDKDNTLDDNTSLSDNTGGNGGGQTSNPDNKPSTPSNPSNSGNNNTSNPGTSDTGKDDSKKDDSKKDDSKKDDSKKDDSGKDDSKKDDTKKDDKDVFPIHLDPSQNESAMDSSTGIEVTADGTTYKHNEDGTYSKVGDQDLKHDENGNALVEKDNLQDNTEEKVEVPKTGEEKPLDEAIKDMSEEEQNNLIGAIEDFDWNNFFDSQPQQSGPRR